MMKGGWRLTGGVLLLLSCGQLQETGSLPAQSGHHSADTVGVRSCCKPAARAGAITIGKAAENDSTGVKGIGADSAK